METAPNRHDQTHRFHTGSFFPELESALAQEITEFKHKHGPLAPLSILVPTNLLKTYLPRRLAETSGAHAHLRFQTLTDLIRSLTPPGIRPLPPLADDLIVRELVAKRVPANSYFGPVREGLGFRAALLAAIRDLKQADLSPSTLRTTASLPRDKFDLLAHLYEAYQSALQAGGFSDEDDLLKRATQSLATRPPPLGARLLIYGFYDFHHLQREFIAALAHRMPVTVLMPYHPNEAFQYAEPTLRWFGRILGVEPETFPVTGGDGLPRTLENLRSRLFLGRELEPGDEPDPTRVHVLSAPGEPREAKEILRDAVRFATPARTPLHQVAVLARRVDSYANAIGDCAGARDWLVHVHGGGSLLHDPVAQAVLLLPRMVREDFGRRTVLEFLSLAPIRVDAVLPEPLRAGFLPSEWGRISAEAGIVRGGKEWLRRTATWIRSEEYRAARAAESGEPSSAARDGNILVARAMGAFLQKLIAALGPIPDAGTWSVFATAIEDAARALLRSSEELDATLGCIRALADLETIRLTVGIDEFVEFAQKSLGARRVSDARFEEGGLFVGGVENCRGVTWPMVIIPGLVESSFPRVVREDPILLDGERKRINEVLEMAGGAPPPVPRLPLKRDGHQEERLLFQLAVESARERLTLTYPRLDPFTGAPRVPSIFLLHVIEALRGGTASFASLERDAFHRRIPLRDIDEARAPGETLDPAEYDLAALHASLSGGERELRPYLDAISPWITRGLACERMRWGSPVFTEFDGVFASKDARAVLAREFEGRTWSVTTLERFARNPFGFFLTEVLGIQEVEEPEDAESISALDLGSLWHAILRDVTVRFQEENLWPLRVPERNRQLDLALAIASKHCDRFEKNGVTGYPLVWDVCREKLLSEIESWLDEESTERDTVPLHVEFSLPVTSVFGIPIQGRVDRIDRAVLANRWRVCDYKTSGKPFRKASFNQGLALQIPLYMLALEAGGKPPVGSGYYFYVTRRGGRKKVGWTRDELRAAEPALQAMLKEMVDCIQAGRFFLTDRTTDVAGVALPGAALESLMEIKQADPQWGKLASALDENTGDDNE